MRREDLVTLFEKEAEERARKLEESQTLGVYDNDEDLARDIAWNEGKVAGYEEGFKYGAEFGYNKANEWHYPSKGEYPKECENVLCYCKVVNVEFYRIGHTIISRDNKIRWWSSNRSEELNVYAWKEITPPKELEK